MSTLRPLLAAFLLVLVWGGVSPRQAQSQSPCQVISTADAGPGSLRTAIACANALPGHQTIEFNIGGGGTHVISLLSPLPPIFGPVTIDGSTQSGNSAVCTAAIPDRPAYKIVLDGTNAGVVADGLRLAVGSDGSTIQGLNIRGFNFQGITVF